MSSHTIKLFTIADVTRHPEVVQGLEGIVGRCDDAWIRMLNDNPEATPSDPALMVAVVGNKVVVRLGFYAATVRYDGRTLRTYWLDGFFRDPSYPDRAVAGMLFLQAIRHSQSVVASGAPAPRTQALYRAAGLKELDRLKRFVYFYRAAPIASKVLRFRPLAAAAGLAADPLRGLYYALRTPRRAPQLSFVQVEQFSQELDALLDAEPRNCFVRYSRTLNWAMRHRRLQGFEIRREGKLTGYCILKQRRLVGNDAQHLPPMNAGILLDYYLADQSSASREDVVLFAIRRFREAKADILEFHLQEPSMADACRRLGLKHFGGNRVFFKPSASASPAKTDSWFYTHATGDVLLMPD